MSTELPSQPMEYFREKYTNADERNLYIWATKKSSYLVKNEVQWDLGIIAGKRAHLVPESGDDFGYCRMFHSRRRAFYPNIFPVVELDCCRRSLYAFSFILPPLLPTAQIFPQYLTVHDITVAITLVKCDDPRESWSPANKRLPQPSMESHILQDTPGKMEQGHYFFYFKSRTFFLASILFMS